MDMQLVNVVIAMAKSIKKNDSGSRKEENIHPKGNNRVTFFISCQNHTFALPILRIANKIG